MSQIHDMYIKITGDAFRPMNLPVGYVWRVNDRIAQYVVNNGDAIVTDSAGDPLVPPWAPTLKSSDANGATVTLTYDMEMLVDTQLGLTVTVDDVEATILGVAANVADIEITLTAPVTAGQVVVLDYDKALGNIRSNATVPVDAPSIIGLTVPNTTP